MFYNALSNSSEHILTDVSNIVLFGFCISFVQSVFNVISFIKLFAFHRQPSRKI